MMTVKEYLGQARWLDQRINNEVKEAARLREMMTTVGASSLEPHYNPNCPTEAPYVRSVERFLEMEREIDKEIDRLVDLKKQIKDVISALPDVHEQLVLTYRYVHSMTWEQISHKMHTCSSTVRRWHDLAIERVDLPKNYIVI